MRCAATGRCGWSDAVPTPLVWTDAMDRHVLAGRSLGIAWVVIAAELRVSRNAAIERARRLGVAVRRLGPPMAVVPAVVISNPIDVSDRRRPLAAGDPASWGALAALTPSIGAAWPGPRPNA